MCVNGSIERDAIASFCKFKRYELTLVDTFFQMMCFSGEVNNNFENNL